MLRGVDAAVARDEIRQLLYRYAWCLDARDVDGLVALFVESTRSDGRLRASFTEQLARLGPTTLLVGNHLIDFDPADERLARGIVYCRGYISEPDGFIEQMIVYFDRYRHDDDDHWRFVGRTHELFYGVRTSEQPYAQPPAEWPARSVGVGTVPFRLESWRTFTGADRTPPEGSATRSRPISDEGDRARPEGRATRSRPISDGGGPSPSA